MRALLVLLVLGLLFVLVKYGTDLDVGISGINPVVLGYGALFAAGLVAAELLRPLLSLMSPVSRFVVVAVIAALVWFGFEQARDTGIIPDSILDPSAIGQDEQDQTKRVMLQPAWDGVFRTVAQVNNMSLGVIVETGTPFVMLQYEEAERLGLHPERLEYNDRLPVGDRKVTAARTRFLSVRIDDIELIEVDAAIAEPGALESSLIGLSFLSRLKTAGLIDNVFLLRN